MKTKIRVEILLTGIILGAFLFCGTVRSVNAQDTPTPGETPTEVVTPVPTETAPTDTTTPAPTEPAPTDISTPVPTGVVPTDSATPVPTDPAPTDPAPTDPAPTDPALTDLASTDLAPTESIPLTENPNEATGVMGLMAMSFLGAPTPICGPTVGPVWFMYNGSKQYCPTLTDAIEQFKIDWLPSDGIIHIDTTTTEPNNSVWFYPELRYGLGTTWLKEIRGPELDDTYQTPIATINSALVVTNFTNGFTISNIQIIANTSLPGVEGGKGALSISEINGTITLTNLVLQNSDPDGVGLHVQSNNGNVVITNVKSDGNAGGGAEVSTKNTGSISITNSSFDNNGGNGEVNGLSVENAENPSVFSPITINGISVSGNGFSKPNSYGGLIIKKSGALTIRNSMFNDNYVDGINNSYYLFSIHGNVILDNITASNNYQVNDPNPDTGGTGIELTTYGSITASNIIANNNLGEGIHLDSCNFDGLKCASPVVGNLTITNGEFEENKAGEDGQSQIWAEAKGAVTLTNVIASQYAPDSGSANGDYGAFLRNDQTGGAVYPVTVTNGVFSGNEKVGLNIDSLGSINISKIVAENNYNGQGVSLNNSLGSSWISVSGKFLGDNQFNKNGSHGLEIHSKGNISVNSTVANENVGNGGYLENILGTVTVSNSAFNDNKRAAGLVIKSINAITLTDIQAIGNNNDGDPELIDRCDGIKLDNRLSGNGFGNISLTRITSNNNYGWGINVLTNGQINGYGLSSSGNKLGGAILNNQESGIVKNIVLSNSVFNNNNTDNKYYSWPGLLILTKGAIILTNIGASGNGITGVDDSSGITIENTRAGLTDIPGSVTINNSSNPATYSFSRNNGLGLNITNSIGSIYLNGVWVDENQIGAEIHNGYGTGNVTIINSHFNGNLNGFGIFVDSRGKISLTNTDASKNTFYGAKLDNQYAIKYLPVSIINNAREIGIDFNGFSGNTGGVGLTINARGAVTLANVEANLNAGEGATIDIINAPNFDLKITNSYFDGNKSGENGLYIKTSGNISLIGGSATGNIKNGATLDNIAAGIDGTTQLIKFVTISNFKFNNNINGYGVAVGSYGIVSLTNVEANQNSGDGAEITNTSKANTDVKLTNSHFDSNINSGSGLSITTNGNIVINGGSASGNNNYGVMANNQGAGIPNIKSITISNFNFNGNITGYGLDAKATGAISLTNVQANGNGTYGISLDNSISDLSDPLKPWVPGMGITVKNTTANGNNDDSGLEIVTKGTVFLDFVNTNVNKTVDGHGITIVSTPLVAGSKSVTINRTVANLNIGNGIDVDCGGVITINGLTANGNLGFGAEFDNLFSTNTTGVTIVATLGANSFNMNQGIYFDQGRNGLSINTRGQVSMTSVTANENKAGDGIFVNNKNCSGTGCPVSNVIMNKITTRNNKINGVTIEDTNAAAITITGLISLSNEGSGIRIISKNSMAKTSLINDMFMANGDYGIEINKTSTFIPVLTGTAYFGNTGPNLYIY